MELKNLSKKKKKTRLDLSRNSRETKNKKKKKIRESQKLITSAVEIIPQKNTNEIMLSIKRIESKPKFLCLYFGRRKLFTVNSYAMFCHFSRIVKLLKLAMLNSLILKNKKT